jgi:ubiquinone/menaquinone biosynthesis methyltransferases
MLRTREENLQRLNDHYSRFLSARIAEYASLSDSHRYIISALFKYYVSHSSSTMDNEPINFRISHSILGQQDFEMSSIILSNPKPLFTVLSGVIPLHNRTSFHIEKIIDRTAKYYASSGCAVVASKISFARTLTKPMLIALDVEMTKDYKSFTLMQPSYQVYSVGIECELNSHLLGEYDFLSIINKLKGDGIEITCSQLENEAGFGYVARMTNQYGYKFSINLDLLNEGDVGQKRFLCILPLDEADRFEKVCGNFKVTPCGKVFEGIGESVLVRNGEKLSFSSILIDEIFLAAVQCQFYGNSAIKFDQRNVKQISQNCSTERSIQDVLENIEYISPNQLTSRFDSCINTYRTNFVRSPYVSYFAVKDIGRFLVSLNTYVPDANFSGELDATLRVIYEHQVYGATPALALVRLIERPGNASKGQQVVDELTKFFDIFSIRCNIEREEVGCISTDYILSFGLVSRLDQKVSDLMSGFKQKGEVVYALNLLSGGAYLKSAEDQASLFSNRIISDLISSKMVNAISPISKGGLFYSLFSMGENQNLGFDITGDTEQSSEDFLFDDSIGRVVLTVSEEHEAQFVDYMRERGVSITLLGHVTKGEIRIDDVSYGFIADLKKKVSFAFQNNIKKMASKKVVKPYEDSQSTKKEQVASMFDNIATKYDFLNHFLSLGIDKLWRKRLVKEVGKYKPSRILDVATGTGDLAIALSKLKPQNIVGIDIAIKMVEVGIDKVKERGLDNVIYLQQGDSETINFDSNTFDFATVAFGVRNFENPPLGLREMYRVLKPGGGLAVLEFAMPTKFPIKQLYKFYFFKILPFIGRFFSKDSSAYTYLPESVEAFPSGVNFIALLKDAGFAKTRIIPLTFGVANIYIGEK